MPSLPRLRATHATRTVTPPPRSAALARPTSATSDFGDVRLVNEDDVLVAPDLGIIVSYPHPNATLLDLASLASAPACAGMARTYADTGRLRPRHDEPGGEAYNLTAFVLALPGAGNSCP